MYLFNSIRLASLLIPTFCISKDKRGLWASTSPGDEQGCWVCCRAPGRPAVSLASSPFLLHILHSPFLLRTCSLPSSPLIELPFPLERKRWREGEVGLFSVHNPETIFSHLERVFLGSEIFIVCIIFFGWLCVWGHQHPPFLSCSEHFGPFFQPPFHPLNR